MGDNDIHNVKKKVKFSIQVRRDNMAAFPYLMKMGMTKNQEIALVSKEIWDYLLS